MKKKSPTFDPDQVGYAARILETGEFKLFQNAYLDWYGQEASEAAIEPYFEQYLTNGIVPFWMRSYIRGFLNDPKLRARLARQTRVSTVIYFVPLVFEYALLMYYLL